MNYRIAENTDTEALANEVNDALDDGYELHGSLVSAPGATYSDGSADPTMYLQAMVRNCV